MTHPRANRIFKMTDENRPIGRCRLCNQDVKRDKILVPADEGMTSVVIYTCPTHGQVDKSKIEFYLYPS